MAHLVTHESDGTVATITMDDGKVNVLSLQMIMEVNAALDRAAADRQVVVLTGREGIFSAGFDLAVLRAGTYAAIEMLRAGFELAERDLELRGEGALLGTRQSGLSDLRFTRLRQDRDLLEQARGLARELIGEPGPWHDEADVLLADADPSNLA